MIMSQVSQSYWAHDEVIVWKHFLLYWPFVPGIHLSPVNSPHKGQWCRALMFSLICAWINSWVNNSEAGDLRCHCAHYDGTVISTQSVKYNHHLANQYMATWFKPEHIFGEMSLVHMMALRNNGNQCYSKALLYFCLVFNLFPCQ